jgi:hypothetical protein
MPENWNDDDQLLAELGEAVRGERAVPARFVEIGKAAFAWRDVDADLAALAYDSATSGHAAGTRAEPAGLRALSFVASRLTIELEVAPDALLGQLVPPQAGEVELHLRDGRTSTVPVDEVGWFVIRPLPAGLFHLRVRPAAGDPVRTEWVRL